MLDITLRVIATVALASACASTPSSDHPVTHETVPEPCPIAQETLVKETVGVKIVHGVVLYDQNFSESIEGDPPLAGVRLIIFSGPQEAPDDLFETWTDQKGVFSFDERIPDGSYTLLTCLDGWDAVMFKVDVSSESADKPLTIQINPS